MSEAAAKHIDQGIAWFGFWLMIGLAHFGEPSECNTVELYKLIEELK